MLPVLGLEVVVDMAVSAYYLNSARRREVEERCRIEVENWLR